MIISIILAVICIFGAAALLLSRKQTGASGHEAANMLQLVNEMRKELNDLTTQSRTEMQKKLDRMDERLVQSVNDSMRMLQQHSTQTSNIVRDVTERLTKLDETNKQVLSFSEQLHQFEQILKNPKQRGVLGEYFLETVLRNVLPPEAFQMQYKFKDGEIVDAVVFVKEKVVPIDSKFSLENYNRLVEETNPAEREKLEKALVNDLKERIKETGKYVRPDEGTMDFAFMFIPHEAIYYDLLTNKIGAIGEDTENILQRAASKYHVIVVSPTSFLAYLQTVLQGLRALQIEEQAQEIRQRVTELGKHMEAYGSYHQSIGKHLTTAVNQYNLSTKEFAKIDKDVYRISDGSVGKSFVGIEAEKPSVE